MRHPGALRNFASTLRELAGRGHQVHLSFVMQDKLGDGKLLWELSHTYQNITYTDAPKKTPLRFWLTLCQGVRFWVDYVRYLGPEFKDAPKLTLRARERVPSVLARVTELTFGRSAVGRRLLTKFLLYAERAIPADEWVAGQITSVNPDLVLVTPLVDIGSDQVDVLKAAKGLGYPTGLCVHSWDNLTTKGLIRIQPDKVFVWNEAQRTEAASMHDVPPAHVVVTGAPVYDQWFDRQPSTTREAFCAKTGLRADRPFFLYLGSSAFIAPNEVDFILEWIKAVRSAPDARLREAGLLIRPHPENLQPWQRLDDEHFENVSVWPRGGANPVDAARKNDYFDSLYHSAAAVGINTSAQIEAGVVGRPVYTVRSAAHSGTQEGTLHFNYLINFGGGLVHDAKSFDEHVAQLSTALDRSEADRLQLKRFVEGFVRPNGLDRPATPQLADGIEALGAKGRQQPARTTLGLLLMRAALYPVALALKVVRQFKRTSRKRERQLRPLSAFSFFLRPLLVRLDAKFSWKGTRFLLDQEETVAIRKVVYKLSRTESTVVIGPWLSEVGFEVLYWIPFLNWAKTYRPFDADRLIVISRGGVADWYRNISPHYLELFDFFTPEEFRQLNDQRITEGKQKQRVMSEFDRLILKKVQVNIGRRSVDVLHPMHMYRLFHKFWRSQMSIAHVDAFTLFQSMPPIDRSDIAGQLPKQYVAARFYFNDSFPDTSDNRQLVSTILSRLAETTDVVLLNPALRIDDHLDLESRTLSGRIHHVAHLMSPRTNLGVQTKIISGASAFIGNYGGLSYVAPFYGVNSVALYSNPDGFLMQHLQVALHGFSKLKPGSFTAVDARSLDAVGLVTGVPQLFDSVR